MHKQLNFMDYVEIGKQSFLFQQNCFNLIFKGQILFFRCLRIVQSPFSTYVLCTQPVSIVQPIRHQVAIATANRRATSHIASSTCDSS